MTMIQFPGEGVATAVWSEAAGGFWCIRGFNFTEPYPAHVHSRFTVAVVDSGTFRFQTLDGIHVAQPGAIVVLNSFRVHSEMWEQGSFRVAFLSRENIRAVTGHGAQHDGEPSFDRPVLTCPQIATRIRVMCDAVMSRAPATMIEAELARLMIELRGAASMARAPLAPPSRAVAVVRDRLHAGIAEPLSIPELARVAGQSQFHLIRTFRREVGLPPHAYVDQLRIAEAKEMLVHNRGLSAIAFKLGFCDQSHFTRSFKRSSLVPPGQWSRMIR